MADPVATSQRAKASAASGVTPKLKQQIFDSLNRNLNVRLPTTPDSTPRPAMEAAGAEPSKPRVLFWAGNLFGSNPNSELRAISDVEVGLT